MKLTVIGDVHGHVDRYIAKLAALPHDRITVQVGDMGVGFSGIKLPVLEPRHRFFRGNHDRPDAARAHPNYMGAMEKTPGLDFGLWPHASMFWLAGAWSIDAAWRIEGVSWWRDEELSQVELNKAFDLYVKNKPRFVLSHDCPTRANNVLLHELKGGYFTAKQECGKSRTCQAMQAMLEAHQPEEWVFGHYHVDKAFTVPGFKTRFQCVGELSTYDLYMD